MEFHNIMSFISIELSTVLPLIVTDLEQRNQIIKSGTIEDGMLVIDESIYDEIRNMKPLIQSLTKNLPPCPGCGSSAVDYFVEQSAKGEPMTFILQVQVETETEDADLFTLANSDRSKWKVISGNPARQQSQPAAGQITGSTFQRTTTQPTPALNG